MLGFLDVMDMTDNKRFLDSVDEAAAHFRKTKRTIYRWVRDGFPLLADGRVDLDEAEVWVRRRRGLPVKAGADSGGEARGGLEPEARSVEGSLEDDGFGKEYWDSENKKYQAGLRRLELQKRQGEIIERVKVEDLFISRIAAVKQGLLTLTRSLPPELIVCQSEREMAVVIDKLVRELLETFARPLPPM